MQTNLSEITARHGRDVWKDAVFVVVAVILTAISIGSVTAKAGGRAHEHHYSLTVIETSPPPELAK